MSSTKSTPVDTSRQTRWLVISLIVIVAFFASYRFAQAQSQSAQASITPSAVATAQAAPETGVVPQVGTDGQAAAPQSSLSADPNAQAAGGCGGGCCGGGGPAITKQAEVVGGVQKITVDLSSGSYNPSEIVLTAGVPAEITFGQGSGCLAQVQSQQLGFFEDLQSGPKTVKIPALKAGTYGFSCGMSMVTGSIVVK